MLHISTFLHFSMRYLTDQNTFELCNYICLVNYNAFHLTALTDLMLYYLNLLH